MSARKKFYTKLGVLLICTGLIIGWIVRSVWEPTFDIAGPFTHQLLVDIGLITALATRPLIVAIVSITGTLLAFETRHLRMWTHIAVTISLVIGAAYFLKSMFAIPRPENAIITLKSFGFPSAHAATAGSILIVGLFHLHRLYKKNWKWTVLPAIVITGIIVISRLLIGVHTISDIITGLLLGLGLGMIAIQWWINNQT